MTDDRRLARLLAETRMLLEIFAEIIHTHTGRRSPLIDRVARQIDEYRTELEDNGGDQQ